MTSDTSPSPARPPQGGPDAPAAPDWRPFALLLIDAQQDFWPEDVAARFPAFPANVARLLAFCRAVGIEVVHLRSRFRPDGADWMVGARLRGRIPCVAGTPGAEPLPFAREAPGEAVVIKQTYDGFLTPALPAHLRRRGTRFLLTAGLVTSVCVLLTTAAAAQRGLLTAVVEDCCADRPEAHTQTLDRYGGWLFDRTTVEGLRARRAGWCAALDRLAAGGAAGPPAPGTRGPGGRGPAARTAAPGRAQAGALVRRIVRDRLGAEPARVRRLPFGHTSQVYDVALPGRRVIARLNANPAVFRGTAHTLAELGRLGLPVPTLLAGDLTLERYPVAWLLLEKLPGRDLRFALPGMTPAQMADVAARVAALQRAVTGLPPGRGYGFVPLGARGPYPTWAALVDRDLERGLAAAAGALAPTLAGALRDAAERHRVHLAGVPPVCFLDDATTKNVLVRRGRLAGIVDLDAVCYGDPLYWLALTETAVLADVGEAGRPYLEALTRAWPEGQARRPVVALYAAVHGLDFLGRAHRGGAAAGAAALLALIHRWVEATGDAGSAAPAPA